jgi:hypothetical protein
LNNDTEIANVIDVILLESVNALRKLETQLARELPSILGFNEEIFLKNLVG